MLLVILVAALVLAAIGYALWPRPPEIFVDYKIPGNPAAAKNGAAAAAIERREKAVSETIWAKEMRAQEHGRIFEDFWDRIIAVTNKLAIAQTLDFESLRLGQWDVVEELPHQIKILESRGNGRVMSTNEWAAFVHSQAEDWRLLQSEFRHSAFDPQTNDAPARSRFYFSAHLTNAAGTERSIIEGELFVKWATRKTNEAPRIAEIDTTRLGIKKRTGPLAFALILTDAFDSPDLSTFIEPLNVFDLDGDGIPEIILPSLNRVYRRAGNTYVAESLYPKQKLQVLNGLFGDFDGDRTTDFLFAGFDGVFLMNGAPKGLFDAPPRLVSGGLEEFAGAPALTCGDIDGDGDLDLFVGQYKGPFLGGNMPTPYYDANDGFPSYLLMNDGKGNFRENTKELAPGLKRFRRVYGASFVDLDTDGALDLVVTSDFAGADVYRGDGKGHFVEATSQWLPDAHAFGMSHAFADFNNDGRLDFLMAGMTSSTAERLEHLRLNRPSSKFDPAMRARMTEGNRLYLAKEGGGFATSELSRAVARSGWAWGVSTADFDNDGWEDLYVANGMESRLTVRDYETEFWLHDIFVADSRGGEVPNAYFTIKGGSTRGKGMSYGGYEKNRLFLNRAGTNFIQVAHLFGVASEEDCRNLVATDLNGDGKVDLVFTSVEVKPPYKQRLHVFENRLPDAGSWIGFHFRDEPGRPSPIGARVRLSEGGKTRIGQLVTGDSYRSQHPLAIRFGLGRTASIDSLEIKWPGGESIHIAKPQINRSNIAAQSGGQ